MPSLPFSHSLRLFSTTEATLVLEESSYDSEYAIVTWVWVLDRDRYPGTTSSSVQFYDTKGKKGKKGQPVGGPVYLQNVKCITTGHNYPHDTLKYGVLYFVTTATYPPLGTPPVKNTVTFAGMSDLSSDLASFSGTPSYESVAVQDFIRTGFLEDGVILKMITREVISRMRWEVDPDPTELTKRCDFLNCGESWITGHGPSTRPSLQVWITTYEILVP